MVDASWPFCPEFKLTSDFKSRASQECLAARRWRWHWEQAIFVIAASIHAGLACLLVCLLAALRAWAGHMGVLAGTDMRAENGAKGTELRVCSNTKWAHRHLLGR
jgi:hypothetical protein